MEDKDAELAADVVHLLPVQQQAIATAQLAGCRFEARSYERRVGYGVWNKSELPWRYKWIVTTEYEIFLPDGTSAGIGEDIYECALIALNFLNYTTPVKPDETLFKLAPENEPT